MINNHPYNMPERPQLKQGRIFTQNAGQHFRNQSLQNIPYYNQHQNRPSVNQTLLIKRSTANIEQIIPNSYRPPYYQSNRNDAKHYLPSPRSHNTSSTSNLGNFQPNSAYIVTNQKKQSHKQIPLRESIGTVLDSKQISDKIQILNQAIKSNQKRISQLQKHTKYGNSYSHSQNSKISQSQQSTQLHRSQQFRSVFKYDFDNEQNLKKIVDEFNNFKQEIKQIIISNDKVINEKIKQFCDRSADKNSQISNLTSKIEHNKQQMILTKKQMDNIKHHLQEKIAKNHDFITSIIARIEREIHNIQNPTHQYKSSSIKCTNTAILLRHVQCFKVKKNSLHSTSISKSGQIKITIADNSYFIDNEGYLLDKDQYYLIDSRGMQVRLEQKHIKMLREQSIIV